MSRAANVPPRVLVEVAIDSVDGAIAAERAGADRLELCCALGEGGLTPTRGLLRCVRAASRLPVVAMLRPRGGDFLYSTNELDVLRSDLDELVAAAAGGVALGVLTRDGDLDQRAMQALVQAAAPLPVTCHRAFDLVRDPEATLEQLIELGVTTVLTSGLAATALDGAERIAALTARARGRIVVMAGAGVRAGNVAELVRRTGVAAVHLSATTFVDSPMRHRNAAATMATQPPRGDHLIRRTDGDEVARVRAALDARP